MTAPVTEIANFKTWHILPLYGIFVLHRFLRYLFHIHIRNSRDLGKSIPQYIEAHYFLRELYITSANRINFGLPKTRDVVPKSNPDNILILLCICSANLKFVRPILAITWCTDFWLRAFCDLDTKAFKKLVPSENHRSIKKGINHILDLHTPPRQKSNIRPGGFHSICLNFSMDESRWTLSLSGL